jgi:hypothetical protein
MRDWLRRKHTEENGWWLCWKCPFEMNLCKGNYEGNLVVARAHLDMHLAEPHDYDLGCICPRCSGLMMNALKGDSDALKIAWELCRVKQ